MTMVFFKTKTKSKEIQMISNTSNLHFLLNLPIRPFDRSLDLKSLVKYTIFFLVYGKLYEIIGEYCHNVLLPSIDSPS